MPLPDFLSALDASPSPLLSDGAMGTLLNARGASFEGCLDALNLSRPSLIVEIHNAYLEAGAQVLQTNTFGANRYKLAQHGLQEQVTEINRQGVELIRQSALAAQRQIYIPGDVGPLGVRLAPYGRVQAEQARQAFAEQILAQAEAGADLIILETFSDLSEILEALAAARQVCGLPVVASLSYTRDDLTLLGDSPAGVARLLFAAGAYLLGVTCSGGPCWASL